MEKILAIMKLIPMGDAHAIHTYIIHYQLELYVTEKRKQGRKGRDLCKAGSREALWVDDIEQRPEWSKKQAMWTSEGSVSAKVLSWGCASAFSFRAKKPMWLELSEGESRGKGDQGDSPVKVRHMGLYRAWGFNSTLTLNILWGFILRPSLESHSNDPY